MEQNNESNGDSRAGVATYVVEATVAAILLVIGAVVVYNSVQLGSGWASDGPGAGYFPFYVGVLICLSSAGILYNALLGKSRNTEMFVDREQLKQVMTVLIPAGIYVFATQMIGIYVASAAYIAAFMIVLGKFHWVKSVIVALSVIVLFFMMFEIWFKVPLHKGAYNLLSFIGY